MATAADEDWFDESEADRAAWFFPTCLTHVEGPLAGKPLTLEPWQQAVIGCAFGWKRADGARRYRETFLYVPRKNGKTTLAAGLVILVLFCDAEAGAQVYSCAAERDQAAMVYRHARNMLLANQELFEHVKYYDSFKSIELPESNSFYKALSHDANTKHGFNSHFVVVDELHAHKNRELVDVLITSTGARTQPMVFHITTADYARESICNEKYEYAKKVASGAVRDHAFLPVVYEAVEADDWKAESTWAKANPNLDVSISSDYLRRECERAKSTPSYENTFKRLHLNLRTEQDVRWLGLDVWDQCAGTVDAESLKGKLCYAGLDMSTTTDLSAFVLYFPEGGEVLPFFWLPEDNKRKQKTEYRDTIETWARQGFIELTPGNVVDYEIVHSRISALLADYRIQDIAVDPWNSTQLQTQLLADGFNVVQFRQGYVSMSAPTKELESLILSRKINHGANPVLRWMASNVSVVLDPAGNIKPTKKGSGDRIDGIVALIMAIGRAMVLEQPSSMTTEGVVWL